MQQDIISYLDSVDFLLTIFDNYIDDKDNSNKTPIINFKYSESYNLPDLLKLVKNADCIKNLHEILYVISDSFNIDYISSKIESLDERTCIIERINNIMVRIENIKNKIPVYQFEIIIDGVFDNTSEVIESIKYSLNPMIIENISINDNTIKIIGTFNNIESIEIVMFELFEISMDDENTFSRSSRQCHCDYEGDFAALDKFRSTKISVLLLEKMIVKSIKFTGNYINKFKLELVTDSVPCALTYNEMEKIIKSHCLTNLIFQLS